MIIEEYMAEVISTIENKGDLEKYLTLLRLRKLPFTLDVINDLRAAITKPQLHEMLSKVIEREFSLQWKEIQKKNHLGELNRYRFGEKITPVSSIDIPKSIIITDDSETDANVWQKKNNKKIEKKQKKASKKTLKSIPKNAPKPPVLSKSYMHHLGFVDEIGIIDTVQKLENVLHVFRNKPSKITNTLIQFVASHISKHSIKEYFRDRLIDIKNEIEKAAEERRIAKEQKEQYKRLLEENKRQKDRTYIISDKKSRKNSNSGSESKLYENFEYGLSDWN